jgi:hypothetical protein
MALIHEYEPQLTMYAETSTAVSADINVHETETIAKQ